MERENFNSSELTGQAQNAYPRNEGDFMPDGGSPDIGSPLGATNPIVTSEAQLNQLRRVVSGEATPEEVKAAAKVMLSALGQAGKVDAEENIDMSQARPAFGSQRRGEVRKPTVQLPIFDASEFTDPKLSKIVFQLGVNKEQIANDARLREEYVRAVENVANTSTGETQEQAARLLAKLGVVKEFSEQRAQAREESNAGAYTLYLTGEDMNTLRINPLVWLKGELDKIYAFTSEGSEQDSSLVSEVQSRVAKATSFLSGTDYIKQNPEVLDRFSEEFNNRLIMLFTRSSVQQRNIEGVQGLARRNGVHGVLNTLTFEGGLVGSMHNRIQDLYDDVRVRSFNQHVTPEVHTSIQSTVIEEYLKLAYRDDDLMKKLLIEQVGKEGADIFYSDERKDQLLRAAITRAVRTGYDHFVATQREAVIVSRGKALPTSHDLEGILADPSGLFMAFNYEQLLLAKFGLLNHEQQVFFSAIKRKYAESVLDGRNEDIDTWVKGRMKVDPTLAFAEAEHGKPGKARTFDQIREEALVRYGQSLIKDLMLVNDFYSSPWRIEQFTTQMEDMFKSKIAKTGGKTIGDLTNEEIAQAKLKAEDFGLFMRLRMIHGSPTYPKEKKDPAKIETWKKIAAYRPEDVVKIFRERGSAGDLTGVDQAYARIGLTLNHEDEHAGVQLYDKFKEKYGFAIKYIREKGFSGENPEQIDFSEISKRPEYAQLLNNILGDPNAASNIESVFKAMKAFAGSEGKGGTIDKLMTDVRFEDLYLRSYAVDDALLDRMEQSDKSTGLFQVSRKLSPESGGDAFVRTFNDAKNAAEGASAFLKFLRAESKEEKLKAALEAAEFTSQYGSPDSRAKVFRYTFGSYILLGSIYGEGKGKKATFYEMMGWKSLAGRRPINELQRIFGPQAPAFNNDEMLHYLDEHRGDLVGSHGEELWEEMRRLAKTRSRDRTKMTLYKLFIFALIWAGYEIFHDTGETIREGIKADELG